MDDAYSSSKKYTFNNKKAKNHNTRALYLIVYIFIYFSWEERQVLSSTVD